MPTPPPPLKDRLYALLRWSERYAKTDMVYLTKSGWWINLGNVIVSIASLLLYVVFANALPKEVYGTYQYLISGGAIIGALTLTGMSSAVVRAVAQGYEGAIREAVRLQLQWGVIPFTVGCLTALYYFANGNVVLGSGFLLVGIFTPLIAAFSIYSSFLQGKKDFKLSFWYGMGWNIPYYAVLIGAALLYPHALALLAASLIAQTIALFIAYLRTLRAYRPNTSLDPQMHTYSKHLSVMGLGNTLAIQIDTILAFHFLGPAAVAIYSFSTAIPERLTGFFKFLPAAALPKFSEKTPDEIKDALGSRIWIAVFGMAIFAGVYSIAAPFIFQILFPTYMEAVPYTQVYSLVIVASLSGLFVAALTAQRKLKQLYIYTTVSPFLQIALQIGGVLLYGLWGLILGRLLAQYISLILAGVLISFRRTEKV